MKKFHALPAKAIPEESIDMPEEELDLIMPEETKTDNRSPGAVASAFNLSPRSFLPEESANSSTLNRLNTGLEEKKNVYEQKITSTSINIIKTPRREEQAKAKNEIDFCKKYANIQIGENADFEDRMQFDIYKRATKEQRMILLENLNKDTMPKKCQEKLYERLIDDGKKWSYKKKQLENFEKSEMSRMRAEEKRITKAESDRIYARMMRQQKFKEEVLMKKRAAIEFQKRQEELNEMLSGRSHKSMSKEEISKMLGRFQNDAEQRKKSREFLAKMKEKMLEEELQTYFKPKINNGFSPTSFERSHQFDSRYLSEKKEPLFKHMQSPVIPKTLTGFSEEQYLKTISSLSSKTDSPYKPSKTQRGQPKPVQKVKASTEKTRKLPPKKVLSGHPRPANIRKAAKEIVKEKRISEEPTNSFVPNYKAERLVQALYNANLHMTDYEDEYN